MLVLLRRPRSTQLALFAHPHPRPDWRKLSPEVQQKTLRLLALLLRRAQDRTPYRRQRRRPMSEKIRPHHLERKAILYVRQSSAYQVNNNLESQKLQYAMQERLRQLGWREVEIVDEDLGRSASGRNQGRF